MTNSWPNFIPKRWRSGFAFGTTGHVFTHHPKKGTKTQNCQVYIYWTASSSPENRAKNPQKETNIYIYSLPTFAIQFQVLTCWLRFRSPKTLMVTSPACLATEVPKKCPKTLLQKAPIFHEKVELFKIFSNKMPSCRKMSPIDYLQEFCANKSGECSNPPSNCSWTSSISELLKNLYHHHMLLGLLVNSTFYPTCPGTIQKGLGVFFFSDDCKVHLGRIRIYPREELISSVRCTPPQGVGCIAEEKATFNVKNPWYDMNNESSWLVQVPGSLEWLITHHNPYLTG